MSNPLIGQTLGHYRIIDQLGAGGMGVVYRAQDLKLGRQVAIKVLPAGSASHEEAVERFRREARTASSLNHPNICTIYGFDEQDGQLFLAMELLDGEPLDRTLSGRPLDVKAVLDVATQVADALDAAHVGGILHRDIKPANIFLTRRGQVKVLDFGLAKLSPDFRRSGRDSDADDTGAPERFSSVVGTTAGTIAYMSPEQARGEDVDPRTDLFSFGVVLYEMVTGRQSFPGQTTAVVFDGILNREPAPPSTLNAAVPGELDRIISKALEKDRAMRYQTAADLGADLKRLRRDSSSRHAVPAALLAAPGAATVVLPSGSSDVSLNTSADASASADAASAPTGPRAPAPAGATPAPSSSVMPPAAARTSWLVGAGIGVVAVAALAGGIGAYVARWNSAAGPGVEQNMAAQAHQPADPATADTAAPTGGAPAPATPAPTATAPPTRAAAVPAASASPPTAAAARAAIDRAPRPIDRKLPGGRPPLTVGPGAPAAFAPRDTEAQQRLEVARAKMANNLNDQALADLKQVMTDYPGSRAAAEASFMAAGLFETLGRVDDAMAAHVEFENRFSSDVRVADSKLRRAFLLGRTRQPRAEIQSRALLNEVVRDFPGSPQAQQALQAKLRIESDRRAIREIDPVLRIEVPAVVVTLRTLTEQFPKEPQTMVAYNRLATMYQDMNRHAEAAQVLENLAANFPGNPMDVWWRLGDLYERRLHDAAKAIEAYTKVPPDSPRYGEAQRKLTRR